MQAAFRWARLVSLLMDSNSFGTNHASHDHLDVDLHSGDKSMQDIGASQTEERVEDS